jgi:hypothetical protein
MERYVRSQTASFVILSPMEVMVHDSPLDECALVLWDEARRALAKGIIDALATPMTILELQATLAGPGATIDELEHYLEELLSRGAILTERTSDIDADMLAFNHFGALPIPRGSHPLRFAGGPIASAMSNHMIELGYPAEHLPLTDLASIGPYASTEFREAAGDDQSEAGPRLVVISDGTSIADLHAFNERAVAARAPVLYLAADGVHFVVGPFVDPGRTACLWDYERLYPPTPEMYSHCEALPHLEATGSRMRGTTPRVTVDALSAAATPFRSSAAVRLPPRQAATR